jgi:hypothetical protein
VTSKKRKRAAIKLRQPDHLPVDFSESFITGIHCSMVGALRRHDKLESRPVKICEPYQMLGLVEDDLKDAMGIDTTPVFPNRTIFGFVNENWKSWQTPWGQEVLVSEHFQVEEKPDGIYIFPRATARRLQAVTFRKPAIFLTPLSGKGSLMKTICLLRTTWRSLE